MASPFQPSSTTWEDTDISTRYEKSVIPGIDIEETSADGGNNPLEGINFEGPPTLLKLVNCATSSGISLVIR